MCSAALVALLLLAQAPSEPDARAHAESVTAPDEALSTLLGWADPERPRPDPAALQRALDLDDVRLTTLRERANALRLAVAAASASAVRDGGPEAEDGPDDDAAARRQRLDAAALAVLERVIADEMRAAQARLEQRLEREQEARRRAEEEARRAGAARERALEAARNARSALVEAAYARVAEIEGLNALVARHKGALHIDTAAVLVDVRAAGEDAARLLSLARAADLPPSEAEPLLREVRRKQRALLDGVGSALSARRALPLDLDGATRARQGALDHAARLAGALGNDERSDVERAIAALRAVVASLETELATLREETSERWYRVAERRLEVASILDDARLTLVGKVTPSMRSQLRGLSEDAADNLTVASLQVFWDVAFHVERRAHDALHLDERLSDGLALGKMVWALGVALIVLLLSLWVWRRAPALFERAKKGALRSAQSPASARFIGSWLALFEAVAPRAYLITLCFWLHDVLSPVAPEPELTIVVEVTVWILAYQLASRLLHMLILRLARRRLSLTVVQKVRVLRSVRLALRYGFLVAYLLEVTSRLVGDGVLFEGVRLVALLGAVPVLAVLVQRWRDDIAAAYLAQQPDSRLARAVEQARERWYGFFVAVAAFGVVAAHGVGVLGRDFVLGFEQSRKALAFLFRLRIERQAQRRGLSPAEVSELPEAVRAAFPDEPVVEGRLLVDRFAEVARAREALRRFEGACSLLVSSPWGMGRSTWLHRLANEIDDDKQPVWWTPASRVTTPAGLCASLGEALGRSEAPTSIRELATVLADGERPRVIILDGVEQLFLRSVDGYLAIEALAEVMERTRGRVFWLLASASTAFKHLCQTRFFDQHLGGVVSLPRWSEGEIRDLIQRRQRASGIAPSFEDLIVHDVEGDRLPTQVVETEEGYIRLLWNFAEGNPRVAQLFWLRSLYRTASGELRVRLYSAPAADDLESLSERERFVLSALHLHGALTPSDAARACRLPEPMVRAHVARGVAMGLYAESRPGSGAYVIRLTWWEAALRYLRRKNLLA